ncbi:MAG: efflux RND transporter permease subunit, partial [Cyclobacteriaceae bacterium]|nr:efflux RND transporter permease subunit [Cyclobacteriaceae bacterium]
MNKFIGAIINFSLRNRFLVFFVVAAWIIAGVESFRLLPVESYPDVTNTNVVIITQWPGRSAEEVERFVTIPIETEMNVVPKKATLRSISLFGLSYVVLIFDDNAIDFNSRMEVANHLVNVNLPDGADSEILPPTGPTGEIFRYTLVSSTKSVTELKTIQDWVLDKQFKSVAGVADVVSFGGKVKTIEVSLNPRLLAKYNFTASDIFSSLQKSNINVGGDIIKKGNQAIIVRSIGLLRKMEEVENVIIDNFNNVPIKMKDVASIKESFQPRLGMVGRDGEDDVVEGIVLMRKGENVNKVIDLLDAKIEDLNTRILPKDVSISTFYNRKILNHYTLETVTENVLMGIALVTGILLIFLADWRTTISVAIVIPLAFLYAFILMHQKGMTANLLSIGAIDFGIIIDGAVVMVEGIFVMLATKAEHMGMEAFNKHNKLSWISKTATEMGKSIFTSKLIIITALLPIFSFEKVEGKLFHPLAYTIGFALVGALIISLTLVPILCSLLLRKNVRERENIFVKGIHKVYEPALHFMMEHPRKSIGVAAVLLFISIFSFRFVGSEFLPHLNEGSIYVRSTMPLSISLDESYHFSRKIRAIFKSFPEVRGVMSQTGRPNDGTDATGFFNAEFFVDLFPQREWKSKLTKDQLIEKMQEKL